MEDLNIQEIDELTKPKILRQQLPISKNIQVKYNFLDIL